MTSEMVCSDSFEIYCLCSCVADVDESVGILETDHLDHAE